MKNFFKNFFANKHVRSFIAWICYLYINLVFKTSKIILRGHYREVVKYVRSGKGIVMFAWHGRSLVSPLVVKTLLKDEIKNGKKIVILSSGHRDGRIAAEIISKFNIGSIEGSTINPKKGSQKNKKSFSSLRNIMKALNDGTICALAPDGPRGPAFTMNTKIVEIVKKTNTGIVCVSISYRRKKQFNTWDHFQLAWPFNRIIVEYGKVTKIKRNDEFEKINKKLENELNDLMAANDREVTR